jgi:hypothetical protein
MSRLTLSNELCSFENLMVIVRSSVAIKVMVLSIVIRVSNELSFLWNYNKDRLDWNQDNVSIQMECMFTCKLLF